MERDPIQPSLRTVDHRPPILVCPSMLNNLRRFVRLFDRQSDRVPIQLTIEEIDSQIRGLQMMADLREEHRNWRGAKICYDEIARLRKQRADLLETPPPAFSW